MLSLKEFRSTAKGLPDLLHYAALVAPGVTLCKDGSFLAGWEYRGLDVASSTPEELAMLSERVNAALLQLGSGWMIHVDSIRKTEAEYMPEGAFPDPVSRLIDERRRQFFAGRHCLQTVTYLVAAYKARLHPGQTARMASGKRTNTGPGKGAGGVSGQYRGAGGRTFHGSPGATAERLYRG